MAPRKLVALARYRLRFMLQELDLSAGETVIGRSVGCQLTLEDPLVSRRHARIVVRDDGASIQDLSSRNGLYVQGQAVQGSRELMDEDRIRIGKQELVFSVIPSGTALPAVCRTTGFLCHCARCGVPYAVESSQCPSCGCADRREEDTLTGSGEPRTWSVELSVEVLKRAILLERWNDVEFVLRRVKDNVEALVAASVLVDRAPLGALAEQVAAVCVKLGDGLWARWLLTMYACLEMVPPASATIELARLPESERLALSVIAERALNSVRDRSRILVEDEAALLRLRG